MITFLIFSTAHEGVATESARIINSFLILHLNNMSYKKESHYFPAKIPHWLITTISICWTLQCYFDKVIWHLKIHMQRYFCDQNHDDPLWFNSEVRAQDRTVCNYCFFSCFYCIYICKKQCVISCSHFIFISCGGGHGGAATSVKAAYF